MDIAVIDPPWPQRQGGKRSVRPQQQGSFSYQTLPIPEIESLLDDAILPMLRQEATVFCWATERFLIEAERIFTDRGFKRHTRIVWDKGNGIAPAFTLRFSHEYLLWLYRGKFQPIAPAERGKHRDIIFAPGREHSRKPDEAYDLISKLYPNARRIDVFSREPREGWEQWGDQVGYFAVSDEGPKEAT